MADDLDVEAMLEAPYRKEMSIVPLHVHNKCEIPMQVERVGIATEDSCQLREDRRETEIGSD